MEFDGPIFDTIQPSSWINLHPQKFPTFAAYKLDGPRKKMPGQQAHGRTESCSEGMRIRIIGNWYVHQLKTNPVYRGIGSHGPFINKKGRLSPARIEGRSTSMQAWICQQTRVWMLVQPNFEFSTKHVHGHVGNCLVGHPTCWVVPNLVHTLELHLECTHFIPIYIYIYISLTYICFSIEWVFPRHLGCNSPQFTVNFAVCDSPAEPIPCSDLGNRSLQLGTNCHGLTEKHKNTMATLNRDDCLPEPKFWGFAVLFRSTERLPISFCS